MSGLDFNELLAAARRADALAQEPVKHDSAQGFSFADVAAVLEDTAEEQAAVSGVRTDGVALFYAGKVNGIVGDPEDGKTKLVLAVVAETLIAGHRALVIDLDHNGARAIALLLRQMGVQKSTLCDPERFRVYEPETPDEYALVVADAQIWQPDLSTVDSLGELVAMHGLSSNSADDFTGLFRQALVPLTRVGRGCVVYVDHLAKGADSRAFGGTGTIAKKRATNGSLLRFTNSRVFVPGQGGKARLSVLKDRPGQLRRHCPSGSREQVAGEFELIQLRDSDQNLTGLDWKLWAPTAIERVNSDLDALRLLDPAPSSARDVIRRMGWGQPRATKAWGDFKEVSQ